MKIWWSVHLKNRIKLIGLYLHHNLKVKLLKKLLIIYLKKLTDYDQLSLVSKANQSLTKAIPSVRLV